MLFRSRWGASWAGSAWSARNRTKGSVRMTEGEENTRCQRSQRRSGECGDAALRCVRMDRPRSVGILGAGRSRNGLGPYLARDCERHGLRVQAIAGRDAVRTAAVAADLGRSLGHAVAVCDSVHDLLQTGIDALVIASPMGKIGRAHV